MTKPHEGLTIGWASTDITPDEPVLLRGQFHARVSEGVRDPITATAMVYESIRNGSREACGVMVSCDLVMISDGLRDAVRANLSQTLPQLEHGHVMLSATHTHTGPEIGSEAQGGGGLTSLVGIELDVMDPAKYVTLIARRIADAVADAWDHRRPAGVGYGLGHATIGYNRRNCYDNGETRMYGNPDTPDFSHVEAGTDASVNLLYTWDQAERLTGVIVNVTCPSQVSEQEYQVSADYWHEARQELRRHLGEHVYILPQCSPAGDIVPGKPHTVMDWSAQQRMWQMMGIDQRRDIGMRIAHAANTVLPFARRKIDWSPTVIHRVSTVALTRRQITDQDVVEANALADQAQQEYDEVCRDLEAHRDKRNESRWYKDVTKLYRRASWNRGVAKRFAAQKDQPKLDIEAHVIRIGDLAFATNPFEYYMDFGQQIKARSKAVQTFLVQLAGSGTYLPTQRATEGKSYGALPASTTVGPEGGRELVDWSVGAINAMWPD